MKITALPGCIVLVILTSGCTAFNKSPKSGITILPLGGEVKVTDGSIVYALPLTVFEIDAVVEKTIEIPGPYASYASEMLGLDDVITVENEIWSLGEVNLKTIEELDPSQFYVIQGTSIMQTNALALKASGLILDIHPETYSSRNFSNTDADNGNRRLMFPDRGANEYFSFRTDTAYKVVKADNDFIRVPYLVEKKKIPSVAEVAASAAKKLLELREGKHLILTGETNIFPQDAAAIEEINRLDREYTALFAGKRWTETIHYSFWYTPGNSMTQEKKVLFHFSSTEGIKPANSGGGQPVIIELNPSGKTRELNLVVRPVISEKDIDKNDKLFYRVPDVADICIYEGNVILCTARRLVYQSGNTVTLPANFIIGK